MTKKQAKQFFIESVTTTVIYDWLDTDRPALRQAWNDFVDTLQRNRSITEKQASEWVNPWKGSQ